METKLFIPKKIKIGFQNRHDTFTGKLAYVIYFDEKNKLRKQGSWDNWRDQKIEPIEYENTPQNGFILNKGIQRYSDWGSSRAVVRVYDSRDFEFEISIDNLLGILMHSDVSKRDIVEECVFAWKGADLILLPCNSVEYQESVQYTAKQDMKVSTKELVPGRRYHKKKTDEILTYLGKYDWWEFKTIDGKRYGDERKHTNKGKKHIFWNETFNTFHPTSPSILSSAVSDDIVQDYPFLVDNWFKTINSLPIIGIKVIPCKKEKVITEQRSNWRDYPQLGTVTDNEIQLVNSRTLYNSDTFENISLMKYTRVYDITDSIYVKVLKFERQGRYRWDSGYDAYVDIGYKLKPLIQQFAISKGWDYTNLTPRQYVTIMTELGYGELKYVLQNNTEIEFKDYYY